MDHPGNSKSPLPLPPEVERLCESFALAWRTDVEPRLEDWLKKATSDNRSLLLGELLKIERQRKEALGQQASSTEYVNRFPYDQATVESVFVSRIDVDETAGWERGQGVDPVPAHGVLGDYELLSKLGQGGMGIVYKARDKKLNRVVALKLLLAGSHATSDQVERFQFEARAAAALDHPHIVPIYEIGAAEGKHFFALKYIAGESLAARLREGPLEMREAATMIRSIASAVHYAHEQGVVHRDLKPANILLTPEGEPCVTDFGLAKRIEMDSGLTATGLVLGTPSYMPPEQAAARTSEVDAVSDVYSLGGILYCMLTGRAPFHAANVVETIKQVLEQEPARPRSINAAVDADLETICLKCLEKEKGRRYPSAAALAQELTRFLNGEAIHARRAGKLERAWRWCKRKPLYASVVAMTFLLIGVLVAFGMGQVQLRASRRIADLHEYYGALESLRNQILERPVGWTAHAPAEIRRAAKLMSNDQAPHTLRSLTAEVLSTFDLELLDDTIRLPTDDVELAVSADSRNLAWAPRSSAAVVQIRLVDLDQQKQVATLQRNVTLQFTKDRVRTLAFSPDGKWLAAGMQSGAIWCWNTFEDHSGPFQEIPAFTDSELFQVAFSRDSQSIYACGVTPGPLKRWELQTNWIPQAEVCPLCEHFALSDNGRWLATSGETKVDKKGEKQRNVVMLRDARTGTLVEGWPTMMGHEVCFSQDGRLLAVTQEGRLTIQLYSLLTFDKLRELHGERGQAEARIGFKPAFVPGTQLLAANGNDSRIRVWDVASGQIVGSLSAPGISIPPVAIFPNGQRLAVATNSTLRQYEFPSAAVYETLALSSEPIDDIAFSQDGRRLYTLAEAYSDQLAYRTMFAEWNVATGARINEIHWRARPGALVNRGWRINSHFNELPGGELLASASLTTFRFGTQTESGAAQKLAAWTEPWLVLEESAFNLSTEARPGVVDDKLANNGRSLQMLPGESATVPLPKKDLDRFRTGMFLQLRLRVEGDLPATPVFEMSHRVGSKAGSKRDIHGREIFPGYHYFNADYELWYPPDTAPEQAVTIHVFPDSGIKSVYVDCLIVLPLQEVATKSVAASRNKLPEYHPLQVSQDGRTIWGIEDGERVVSWDARTGEERTRYDNRPLKTLQGDFVLNDLAEADGHWFVARTRGDLLVFDPKTGLPDLKNPWPGPGGSIRALASDPARRQLALGTLQGKIQILDARTKEVVANLGDHTDSVECVEFSADGQWLISGSLDRTVRIWERHEQAFRPLLQLRMPHKVRTLRLSADRQQLAVLLNGENAVRLWRLEKLREQLAVLNPLLGW
jgi:WD40 repeat protein/tRNA A-37 threonylcarbamoyl transferase component Bud32